MMEIKFNRKIHVMDTSKYEFIGMQVAKNIVNTSKDQASKSRGY